MSEEKEPTHKPVYAFSSLNKTEAHAVSPEDMLKANKPLLHDLESHNQGTIVEHAIIPNNVAIGEGSIVHSRTTIRGPAIIGEDCDIGPNVYIGSYTSIGDHATIRNTEIENSIIMEGAHIDCGRRVTDSLIGRRVKILGYEQKLPKGHRLILRDMPQSPSNPKAEP